MSDTQKPRTGEQVKTCVEWAGTRAKKSQYPGKFMVEFEGDLSVLMRSGAGDMLDAVPHWQDPTHLAAEIEALSAYRALQHWGTDWGKLHHGRKWYAPKQREGA